MNAILQRRRFLATTALGAGSLALRSLLSPTEKDRNRTQGPHHRPTAKSVIFLFMSGGPSQVDTLDPKPLLEKLAGQNVPDSIAARVPRIKRAGLSNVLASPWEFRQYGESGISLSSLLPGLAQHADRLCVIRSMSHRNPVHGPGECVALSGSADGNRPSLGAWSTYGLGDLNQQLPEFISMNLHTDGMQYPQAAGWGSGFLPARVQGTVVEPSKGIQHARMPVGVSDEQRRMELDAIRLLNERFLEDVQDHEELEARIQSYERAFELQTAGPELFDLKDESEQTLRLYGIDGSETERVGKGCLLARRMVERGVRFVQLRVGGWDAHGNIKANHEKMALRTDTPISGLLHDLERRGLLDSTLLVWGGEFGRTPTMEGRGNGRDHSPIAYSVWMAGGGVQGGKIIGASDELGYTVEDRPVGPVDLHATILYALGLDSEKLVYNHHGLIESPLGVNGTGPVLEVFG